MAYVIKEWRVSQTPDANGVYVEIKGRDEGIISFILSLLNIEPTVSLMVTQKNIVFIQGSLSGFIKRIIPFSSVSSMLYGYSKPWKTAAAIIIAGLVMGILFGAGNRSFGAFLITVIIAISIAIAIYFTNKKLTIGIVEDSGVVNGIEFKRSVIEGKKIDERNAEIVIDLIQYFVDAKH